MKKTHMQGLLDMKQSVWLDDLSREMTRSGELRALIDSGLRGLRRIRRFLNELSAAARLTTMT